MKTILLTTALLLSMSSLAFAQGGIIAPYSDANGTECQYTPVAGLAYIYIYHQITPQASASQFRVDYSQIADPYISETLGAGLLGLGSSATGIAISYSGCKALPLLLLTLTFFDQGLTPPCSQLFVAPDPAAPTGTIEVVDCNAVKFIANGGSLSWNGNLGCCTCCIPTESTTWGGVKALYH